MNYANELFKEGNDIYQKSSDISARETHFLELALQHEVKIDPATAQAVLEESEAIRNALQVLLFISDDPNKLNSDYHFKEEFIEKIKKIQQIQRKAEFIQLWSTIDSLPKVKEQPNPKIIEDIGQRIEKEYQQLRRDMGFKERRNE